MTLTATSALPMNLGDGPFAVTTAGLVKQWNRENRGLSSELAKPALSLHPVCIPQTG